MGQTARRSQYLHNKGYLINESTDAKQSQFS
jgi:hypothetical protein